MTVEFVRNSGPIRHFKSLDALRFEYFTDLFYDGYFVFKFMLLLKIHLVSVHIWCDDYLIRNFLVKNLDTNQSRAITQFHYLVWPTSGVPTPIKSILEFRRSDVDSFITI